MRPLLTIAQSESPDGTLLSLHSRGDEWLIRAGGRDLMSSRTYGSEQAMAAFVPPGAGQVLVGGLGMGYTLRAVLDATSGAVTVAELVPAVIAWNRGPLAGLAAHPLDDARAAVHVGDVAELLRSPGPRWDAILLDIDNGPDAFTDTHNAWLYTPEGIKRTRMALRPGGVVVYWSAYPAPEFVRRAERAGLRVEAHVARAHAGRGARHVLYVATV